MGTKTVVFLIFLALSGVVGMGAELVRFGSNGRFSAGLFWLEDTRLADVAVWEFAGVPRGIITLELEAFVAVDCKKKRDNRVFLRLYYRDPASPLWEAADIALRYAGAEGGLERLLGEVSFAWTGGDRMVVMAGRTYACDPHIGVAAGSLRFPGEGPRPAAPPLVPEPTPAPPPPPCYEIPGAVCYPDGRTLGAVHGIVIPEVPVEERIPLPETSGPAGAHVLEEGHYRGVLGGELPPWGASDTQDWYKVVVPPGKAAVVYLERLGSWEYRMFIYDVCGYYREEASLPRNYCLLPHTDEDDSYLIRVFRESGAGAYLISVFYVDLCR